MPALPPAAGQAAATTARRGRNIALGLVLGAVVLLFYALAFVKLAHH